MYVLFSVIGVFAALTAAYILLKKGGMDRDYFIRVVLRSLQAGICLYIGAKLFGIISYAIYCVNSGIEVGLNVFTDSGIVFYGGMLAFLLGFCYKNDDLRAKNTVAVVLPLFHSIARVGCFFAGCCYGIKSRFYGIPYPVFAPDAMRIPVQLIEAALNLVIFAVLLTLYTKRKKIDLVPLYLLLYSLVRYFDEFLRGDAIRGFIGSLSFSQFVSIFVFVYAVFSLFSGKKSLESEFFEADKG